MGAGRRYRCVSRSRGAGVPRRQPNRGWDGPSEVVGSNFGALLNAAKGTKTRSERWKESKTTRKNGTCGKVGEKRDPANVERTAR